MSRRSTWFLLVAFLLAGVLGGCAGDQPTAPQAGNQGAGTTAPQAVAPVPGAKVGSPAPVLKAAAPAPVAGEVTFLASEYTFTGSSSVAAGWTPIRLINQGREVHHLALLRLAEGRTLEDFQTAFQSDEQLPADLFEEAGGPASVGPGDSSLAIVNLQPGTYIAADFIPDPQGVTHIVQGMWSGFTVTAATGPPTPEPSVAVTIEGIDSAFRISGDIPAGAQTIRFTNQGQQAHEVEVVRLQPGTSAADYLAAVETDLNAPAPGQRLGGLSAIEPGDHGYFVADFTAGTYALICFLPDVTDPQLTPHYAKGMVQEVTVR